MKLLDDQLIEMKKEGTTNLRQIYPVSQRRVAKRVIPWCLLGLALNWAVISFVSSLEGDKNSSMIAGAETATLILIAITVIACLMKFFYEESYQARYQYAIESGHLVICKGIILKERGSFPLSRITEVYLDRSWLDLIFGVYILHISTPTSHSGEFAHIVGLTRRNAMGLQQTITEALDSPIDMEMAAMGARASKGISKRKTFSKANQERAKKSRPLGA